METAQSTDDTQVLPSMAEALQKLLAVPVTDENVALNVMVSFLNIAQRRGVFSIDESAKIWECIKKFQR
jgi:hypothetical protein